MEDVNLLRISVIQADIMWEDVAENLRCYGELLHHVKGQTDIAVLPELFTTGMSMNAKEYAESNNGRTVAAIKKYADDCNLAIVGSFMAVEGGRFFNRAFFIAPGGGEYYYDKRHLFSMADEDRYFSSGQKRLIVNYKGWKLCLLVCYDLRFPVWSRNVENGYDVLIYVANWPEVRKNAWEALLRARAIENMCYVCGVNRIGIDMHEIAYHGGSFVCSPKGEIIADAGEKEENLVTAILKRDSLERLRTKFPVWKDADKFSLEI